MLAPDVVLQHRYRVVRQLGQGGMGAVYEAIDQRFNSTVALKETLASGEVLRKAFEREARLLNTLQHAALPHVMDYFFEGDGQFLVMQFIPGDDMGQMLRRRATAFPIADVLGWTDQLLDLLDYLHTHEPPIVHRDIKPENIKLAKRGNIILLDFGLAKGLAEQAGANQTTASVLGYTPNYAPLEQIRGTGTDARSDLYALAATVYHLATGLLPPDALQRADAHIHGAPDPLRLASEVSAHVPHAVARALHAALALRRDERPASAAAMREMLREAARGPVSSSSSPTFVVQRESPVTSPAGLPTTPASSPTTPPWASVAQPSPSTPPPTVDAGSGGGSGMKLFAAIAGGLLLLLLLAGAGGIAWYAMQPAPAPAEPAPSPAEPAATTTPSYTPPSTVAPSAPAATAPSAPAIPLGEPLGEAVGPLRFSASATSTRAAMGRSRYAADLAADDNPATAWVEGAGAAGIGEAISITFSRPARVARLRFLAGYFKSPQAWSSNNRIKRATITLDDGRELHATFTDDMRPQTVDIGGAAITNFTVTIDEVYLGGDELDTAISEIAVEEQ